MSLEEIYTWSGQIAQVFGHLGAWQVLNLALYSLGMMGARHCSPSRVSEQLGVMGKPTTVQRRLERFVDNERIDLRLCCQVWSGWVIGQLVGGRVILLVDETHLGQWLCVMVVQADRGIGCSPRLVRVVRKLGWRFLFRVQKTTRFRSRRGREQRLADLVKLGECWAGRGSVFKKAGWLPATVLVIWQAGYAEPWCLITNDPTLTHDQYAVRYWQEAGFRDLKSDGWQWQASHIYTPDHAQRLLLVMTLAYALTLTAGTLVLSDPETYPVAKLSKSRTPFSVFRLGLRLLTYLDHALHLVLATFITGFHPLPVPCSALPALITVGA